MPHRAAILDDYQNVAMTLADWSAISRDVELKVFNKPIGDQAAVIAALKDFDIVPLIPIVERAGGVVSTWDGGDPRQGGHILAAGDKRLHEQAVKLLTQ